MLERLVFSWIRDVRKCVVSYEFGCLWEISSTILYVMLERIQLFLVSPVYTNSQRVDRISSKVDLQIKLKFLLLQGIVWIFRTYEKSSHIPHCVKRVSVSFIKRFKESFLEVLKHFQSIRVFIFQSATLKLKLRLRGLVCKGKLNRLYLVKRCI